MSSKKKTKQTTHQVMTPNNPSWVEDPLKAQTGRIEALNDLDPYSLVAGPGALQTQAAAGAAGLSGSPWNFDQAGGLLRGVAGAGANTAGRVQLGSAAEMSGQSLLDNLQAYMSPYTKDVVDTSLADFDEGAGEAQAQAQLDLGGDATFGGSGGAIGLAKLRGELARGRGSLSAGLRDQGFARGTALSADDANRRQQAAAANMAARNQFALNQGTMDQQNNQFNAGQQDTDLARRMAAAQGLVDTSTAYDANQRANIGLQGDMGEMLRQIEQQRRMAPISQVATTTGLLGSLPYGLFRGETQDGTSTSTSSTSGLGSALGALGSLTMGLGSLGLPLGRLLGGGVLGKAAGMAGAGMAK